MKNTIRSAAFLLALLSVSIQGCATKQQPSEQAAQQSNSALVGGTCTPACDPCHFCKFYPSPPGAYFCSPKVPKPAGCP